MKHKVRLVAKEYSQARGIEYDEVFAPTTRMNTLWTLLCVAAAKDLEIHQVDIRTAFLD